MALSGSYSTLPLGNYFGVYVEWSAVQSRSGKYSDVTQKIYAQYYNLTLRERTGNKSKINQTEVSFDTNPISESSTSKHRTLLYTHTVRVHHDDFGRADNIPLSATWHYDGRYSSTSFTDITASTTVSLDPIDVSGATIDCNISEVTPTSIAFTATASVSCIDWGYSTNGGASWTTFSSQSSVAASYKITGLAPNTTYSLQIRAKKSVNDAYGVSTPISVYTTVTPNFIVSSSVEVDVANPEITITASGLSDGLTSLVMVNSNEPSVTMDFTIDNLSLVNGENTISLSDYKTDILAAMSYVKTLRVWVAIELYYQGSYVSGPYPFNSEFTTSAENSAPTLSDFTFEDTRLETKQITRDPHVAIQKESLIQITLGSYTIQNGASLGSFSAYVGNSGAQSLSSPFNMGAINEVESGSSEGADVDLVVSVIDSRGYSASVTKTIHVIPYEEVSLKNVVWNRKNDIEKQTSLSVDGTYHPLVINDDSMNEITGMYYRFRQTNQSMPSSFSSITQFVYGSGDFSYYNDAFWSLNADYSWELELYVTDKLSESEHLLVTIAPGIPLMSYRKNRVGIKNPKPTCALDVNGKIKMDSFFVQGFVGELIDNGTDDYEDLDDLTEGGIYLQKNLSDVSTYNGYPTTQPGFLEVVSAKYQNTLYCMQRYTTYDGGVVYIRTKFGGNWSEWWHTIWTRDGSYTPLTITDQPKDFYGTIGSSTTFHVSANGAGITYQWQVDTGDGWRNVSSTGYNTPNLTVQLTTARNGYRYRCVIRNGSGEVIDSEAAILSSTT